MSRRVGQSYSAKWRSEDVKRESDVDFKSFLLSKRVTQGLRRAGFKKPTPIQYKAIPLGRCGVDLIIHAKSGTGKTCVFTVIALENLTDSKALQVLILAPTREIAHQNWSVIKSIGHDFPNLQCHVFIGGTSVNDDVKKMKNCQIAVGTPGRIKQLMEIQSLLPGCVRLLVLDEADKLIADKFTEDINWIYNRLPNHKQVLAASATFPDSLKTLVESYMKYPKVVAVSENELALKGVLQFYIPVEHHPMNHIVYDKKKEMVKEIFSRISFSQCIIFCNMISRVDMLHNWLKAQDFPVAKISSNDDQDARLNTIEQLKLFQCKIVVSTDLTARGIDAENVDLVIHLDLAQDMDTHLHRVGRAGRFGSKAVSITIISGVFEHQKLASYGEGGNFEVYRLPEPIPRDVFSWTLDMLKSSNFETCKEGVAHSQQKEELCSKNEAAAAENFHDSSDSESDDQVDNVNGKSVENEDQVDNVNGKSVENEDQVDNVNGKSVENGAVEEQGYDHSSGEESDCSSHEFVPLENIMQDSGISTSEAVGIDDCALVKVNTNGCEDEALFESAEMAIMALSLEHAASVDNANCSSVCDEEGLLETGSPDSNELFSATPVMDTNGCVLEVPAPLSDNSSFIELAEANKDDSHLSDTFSKSEKSGDDNGHLPISLPKDLEHSGDLGPENVIRKYLMYHSASSHMCDDKCFDSEVIVESFDCNPNVETFEQILENFNTRGDFSFEEVKPVGQELDEDEQNLLEECIYKHKHAYLERISEAVNLKQELLKDTERNNVEELKQSPIEVTEVPKAAKDSVDSNSISNEDVLPLTLDSGDITNHNSGVQKRKSNIAKANTEKLCNKNKGFKSCDRSSSTVSSAKKSIAKPKSMPNVSMLRNQTTVPKISNSLAAAKKMESVTPSLVKSHRFISSNVNGKVDPSIQSLSDTDSDPPDRKPDQQKLKSKADGMKEKSEYLKGIHAAETSRSCKERKSSRMERGHGSCDVDERKNCKTGNSRRHERNDRDLTSPKDKYPKHKKEHDYHSGSKKDPPKERKAAESVHRYQDNSRSHSRHPLHENRFRETRDHSRRNRSYTQCRYSHPSPHLDEFQNEWPSHFHSHPLPWLPAVHYIPCCCNFAHSPCNMGSQLFCCGCGSHVNLHPPDLHVLCCDCARDDDSRYDAYNVLPQPCPDDPGRELFEDFRKFLDAKNRKKRV